MKPLIRLFFRTLRLLLSPLLLLTDRLTAPRGIQRDPVQQQQVDTATRSLALYQFAACPFCIKTRRAIRRLSLDIETRDAQRDPEHRAALRQGGGEVKVPCLRIEETDGGVRWMYESGDIIAYLNGRFGTG